MLVHGSGRIIMVLGVILMSGFVFLRNLRQLEIAGDFGFIVVLIMVIVIMVGTQLTLYPTDPQLIVIRVK